jgi:toxin CptA
LRSLLEASLWVAGGLLLLRRLPITLPALPTAFALNGWTVVGAALLGLGAFVNRACVFGAVARLGSGDWAYLATPLGFFIGCLSVGGLFAAAKPQPLPAGSPLWAAPGGLALGFALFMSWRIGRPWRPRRGARGGPGWWTPHVATVSIGIAFLALLLLEGAWAYTDALAELARGMVMSGASRTALFACLLLGALWGGWRAGLLRAKAPSRACVLRCLTGGMLMGWGSLLIPGGNDGLILLGLPLLWPYAWVAFGTMCAVIALAQLVGQRRPLARAAPGRGGAIR